MSAQRIPLGLSLSLTLPQVLSQRGAGWQGSLLQAGALSLQQSWCWEIWGATCASWGGGGGGGWSLGWLLWALETQWGGRWSSRGLAAARCCGWHGCSSCLAGLWGMGSGLLLRLRWCLGRGLARVPVCGVKERAQCAELRFNSWASGRMTRLRGMCLLLAHQRHSTSAAGGKKQHYLQSSAWLLSGFLHLK